jgi:BlaI family transcriptional regulator, penicillinase repressor
MPKPPAISDAEWEVMNVFWHVGTPLMAGDVVDILAEEKTWSPRTIKTLLNRLIKKGALKFDLIGKSYRYRPGIGRDQCVRAATESFMSRLFGGSPGPMLIQFVNNTDLSTAEVEELKRLLENKKARTRRPDKG